MKLQWNGVFFLKQKLQTFVACFPLMLGSCGSEHMFRHSWHYRILYEMYVLIRLILWIMNDIHRTTKPKTLIHMVSTSQKRWCTVYWDYLGTSLRDKKAADKRKKMGQLTHHDMSSRWISIEGWDDIWLVLIRSLDRFLSLWCVLYMAIFIQEMYKAGVILVHIRQEHFILLHCDMIQLLLNPHIMKFMC